VTLLMCVGVEYVKGLPSRVKVVPQPLPFRVPLEIFVLTIKHARRAQNMEVLAKLKMNVAVGVIVSAESAKLVGLLASRKRIAHVKISYVKTVLVNRALLAKACVQLVRIAVTKTKDV